MNLINKVYGREVYSIHFSPKEEGKGNILD